MAHSVNTINNVKYTNSLRQDVCINEKSALKGSLESDYNTLIHHTAFKTLFENPPLSPSNQMHLTLSIKRKHITAENKDIYQITVINKDTRAATPLIIQTEDLNTTLASIFRKTIAATQPPAPSEPPTPLPLSSQPLLTPSALSPRLSAKRPRAVIPPSSPQKATPPKDNTLTPPTPSSSPESLKTPIQEPAAPKISVWERMKEKWNNRSTKKDYLKGHDTDKLYTTFTPKTEHLEKQKIEFSFDPEDMQSPTLWEEDAALLDEFVTPDSSSSEETVEELESP